MARHPFIDHDQLTMPAASAAALGYHMPAEWAPQAAVWVAPPHNPDTWPGCLAKAQAQFDAFLTKLRQVTPVRDVRELGAQTNDSWMRDFGPLFVTQRTGQKEDVKPLAVHDFHFDGWGGKYEVRAEDDVIPQHVAAALDLPVWVHDWVLEGGAIDVNGQGTILTTKQCLLKAKRNPAMTRAELETALHETLGTEHIIWLPGGIAGDDTDGHIDDVARFIDSHTIALVNAHADHPDHAICQDNLTTLRRAQMETGDSPRVIELPAPEPMHFDFPADGFQPGGPAPLPASYANFLISNGVVFVPTFGQPSDDRALTALDNAMPGYRIEPVRCDWLVVGLGTLHCLTMQQPGIDGTQGAKKEGNVGSRR
jgi:agmatine deiminase